MSWAVVVVCILTSQEAISKLRPILGLNLWIAFVVGGPACGYAYIPFLYMLLKITTILIPKK